MPPLIQSPSTPLELSLISPSTWPTDRFEVWHANMISGTYSVIRFISSSYDTRSSGRRYDVFM
jgi:hypothetical protein